MPIKDPEERAEYRRRRADDLARLQRPPPDVDEGNAEPEAGSKQERRSQPTTPA